MVHSVPREEVAALVAELRWKGRYLFVTNLSADYYSSFGETWKVFIDAMAEGTKDGD